MAQRPISDASLHPKTVADHHQHLDSYPSTRPRAAEARSRSSRVVSSYVVHPEVWKVALRQAGGDHTRLEVVNWTTVRIR